jgi:uncharacterized damage-inducible protein DinB
MPTLEQLKYPIGHFEAPASISATQKRAWIEDIADLPVLLRAAVSNLTAAQLDTPYREGGWTIRQVVHHLADSHINSYTRFMLAATEDNPTIRPYEEQLWAALPEAKTAAVEYSLAILDAIHARWVLHLNYLSEEGWSRTFFHPASKITYQIDMALGLYSWHGKHHLAHITHAIEANGF